MSSSPDERAYAQTDRPRATTSSGRFGNTVVDQYTSSSARTSLSNNAEEAAMLRVSEPATSGCRQASERYPQYNSAVQRGGPDARDSRRSVQLYEGSSGTQWPPSPSTGWIPSSTQALETSSLDRTAGPTLGGQWHAGHSWSNSLEHRPSGYMAGGFPYISEPSSNIADFSGRAYPQRRPSNRDEFDGPAQYLEPPSNADQEPAEDDLPQLPLNLHAREQDEILSRVNERLSRCAFDFVARYSFPIPLEQDKRPVSVPGDREWSEWVYLLKRLATKRRIPSRVLYNGQIRQFITVLENSLEMRHAAMHQSRPLKDDRNILQLISSGLQVARILKDASAMRYLDDLYVQTERLIDSRRAQAKSAIF